MLGQRDQQELKLRLTGIWDVCVCVLSCILLFAILWTVALQAPLSMEFSRQEYWSGLLFPPPGGPGDSKARTLTTYKHSGQQQTSQKYT